jgi:type IV pilus assembly protein PilX
VKAVKLRRAPLARRQRGIVMYVAIIVLIIMTLAGIVMLRQMTGSLSIAGNVAFKQNATSVADLGTEAGRGWITAPVRTALELQADQAPGYFSAWNAETNPAAFDWAQSVQVAPDDGTGNEVRYIVHRLCQTANLAANDPAQVCVRTGVATGGSKGSFTYSNPPPVPAVAPFYRITTRVTGPRNTVSYTQVVMN